MKKYGVKVVSPRLACHGAYVRSPRILLSMLFLLAGCASDYQAPLDDRSSRLEREAPVIVVDGQTVPATTRAPVATSTGNPTSSTTAVGSAATVVRPIATGSGISRASVTRTPVGNQPPAQVPAQIPAQEPAQQVPAQSAVPAGAVHVVGQGDTLYSIAFAHNMDVRSLALANNLVTPYTIYPGQRLSLSATGVTASAIDDVPQIPAAPAGESAPDTGRRPQAAMDARRTGSVNTRQVDGVTWQWPADGRLLSTFLETSGNRGIDVAGISGQAVYAAADGDVVYAGSGIQGAGNLVIVRHNDRYLSAYMHNSTMLVREGDQVRAGDKIAEMGAGPNGRDMLHFEVRVDGKPVDPVRYLPNR
ncbi:LysM peptidoglycan-binding domain-containing protein [Gammaproteobacteria bacterium LSUCC0112]|nr:LysM peptidoglycan-binding domain-containing protein [Gammaproteobacteria bacterium LSUCC0112]